MELLADVCGVDGHQDDEIVTAVVGDHREMVFRGDIEGVESGKAARERRDDYRVPSDPTRN